MDPALRRSIYRLLTVVTLAAVSARIASAERAFEPSIHRPDRVYVAAAVTTLAGDTPLAQVAASAECVRMMAELEPAGPTRLWPIGRPHPMPTFSSNDKSRWATVRALVEDHTWVVGRRVTEPDGTYRDFGRIFDPGYETVDKVLDPKTQQFYSSKPPLLTAVVAGQYWVLHKLGITLERDRWLVVRLIVWSHSMLALGAILVGLVPVLERYGQTDWGRLFTFACACFGTFLTTFSTSLNNHVPAAAAAFLAVQPWLFADRETTSRYLFTGVCAGLAVALELPALSLAAGLGLGLLFRCVPGTLLAYLPAFLLPIGLQLGLNYAAIGEFQPVYAKLGGADGPWYEYPGSHWLKKPGQVKRGIDWAKDFEPRSVYAAHLLAGHHGVFSLTPIWLLALPPLVGALRTRGTAYDRVLLLTLGCTVAVIVFFAFVTSTANYGGWTSGARWFFWLAPLWLLAVLRSADRLGNSAPGRALALTCLAVSVFSASYPALNPWRHPWIYNWMDALGLIPY
ncbi:MAG: hypothetical protein K1X57_20860 [Gemmataceae bacterium]|nr:hypothetical protein [Gemmataceae bacterium]